MDSVVYDMSSQSEAEPNIFVKKDWISILDNQNANYSGNQCVIDTSQLSNSNKWISYRESYLTIPLQLTLTGAALAPQTAATSADYVLSLKNWYGSVIHSISVDLAGTTIIQQTPFQSLWNNFKLLTTLSYQDLLTIGPSIGFYPDNSSSWSYNVTATQGQIGVSNNSNFFVAPVVSGAHNSLESFNNGFYQRQRAWNFNVIGLTNAVPSGGTVTTNYTALMTLDNLRAVYRSTVTRCAAGIWQASVTATVMLRHLHEFFNKAPLSKGVFMKITLNLNNSVVNFTTLAASPAGNIPITQNQSASTFPLGGLCPLMIAAGQTSNASVAALPAGTYVASLAVGNRPIDSAQAAVAITGPLANISLSAPSYTFNPIYEQAYLSNPVKKIDYSDIYQYQVLGVKGGTNFNNLITNGIASLKSVLIIPYHSPVAGVNASISPLQSAFDTAGSTTSPLAYLSNFNVVISGQNALYNSQRYTYEQFLNQLNGQNGVNGSQVDGMSSGLISQLDFENMYSFYYVNVERCLPIEKGVSKSVNIIGQNMSALDLDLYVFVEYSVSVSINVYTGSRV